jgi:hypothetical protein
MKQNLPMTRALSLPRSPTPRPSFLSTRAAFTPVIEGLLTLPYNSVDSKTEITGGTAVDTSDSGLADPTLAGKYSFVYKGWDLAGVAAFTIPMGKESTKLPSSFKQGFNIKPFLAARKAFGKITMNANLSYNITGEYTDESKIKQNPGDVLGAGIGAEFLCPKTRINWCGEFIYNSLSESSIEGATQSGSSGSQIGLVLGGRYDFGNWKTKLGVDVQLGDEKYRAYDYRVIAGITYLVKI